MRFSRMFSKKVFTYTDVTSVLQPDTAFWSGAAEDTHLGDTGRRHRLGDARELLLRRVRLLLVLFQQHGHHLRRRGRGT